MQINVTLAGGDGPRTFPLKGRLGQTLSHLAAAGPIGITSLQTPALRLAAYVKSLRDLGFAIETELEKHDGDYPGVHARYRLLSAVVVQTCDGEASE